jgi:hypothetical protein
MKRILLCICALMLMADLADDGFLGKVPAVLSHGPGSYSLTTCTSSSGKIASQVWLPLEELQFTLQRWQNHPFLVKVGNTHTKIFCSLHSSSGGLPL